MSPDQIWPEQKLFFKLIMTIIINCENHIINYKSSESAMHILVDTCSVDIQYIHLSWRTQIDTFDESTVIIQSSLVFIIL